MKKLSLNDRLLAKVRDICQGFINKAGLFPTIIVHIWIFYWCILKAIIDYIFYRKGVIIFTTVQLFLNHLKRNQCNCERQGESFLFFADFAMDSGCSCVNRKTFWNKWIILLSWPFLVNHQNRFTKQSEQFTHKSDWIVPSRLRINNWLTYWTENLLFSKHLIRNEFVNKQADIKNTTWYQDTNGLLK